MQITKLSTRGQIVIPEELRRGIDVGTPFVVTQKNDLIILKKVGGLTKEEVKEMKELDKIWKRYDKGEFVSMEFDNFINEMKTW